MSGASIDKSDLAEDVILSVLFCILSSAPISYVSLPRYPSSPWQNLEGNCSCALVGSPISRPKSSLPRTRACIASKSSN